MNTAEDLSLVLNQANDKDWWRGAVIYQIYPRSFQDSDGDGIGDLGGIIKRLPYVASLGVDAIWISPFFKSPMKDFGYDVSDYREIDPMFGTLSDFDRVIEAAHGQGLKVMIDLVLSHTSDQHPWFQESRKDKENPKSDWYVWADAKPDGTPPNNWLSIFGGAGWEWDPGRQQYYQHNFLVSQPDLNFHNPDVQNALLDVARFWLDRGVDGFRFDTINFYFCDRELRDNPALPPEDRNASIAPAVNPYNHQEHLYDKNRPENLVFLRRMRALMEEYPAIAAVGEVGDAQRGMEIMGTYTAGEDLMQMCYAFEFLAADPLDASRVKEVLTKLDDLASEGWACWAFSNHDVERHASRWNLSENAKKLHLALLLMLRGSVCLYQGEELGLHEADVDYKDLQDPYGISFWPEYKGRDGCRTPMVWTTEVPNAGFSEGRPWLPVSSTQLPLSVTTQDNNRTSMLNHYRRMIGFRKQHTALVKGQLEINGVENNVLSFYRRDKSEIFFCAFNMSDTAQYIALPDGHWHLHDELEFDARIEGDRIYVPAHQAFIAHKI